MGRCVIYKCFNKFRNCSLGGKLYMCSREASQVAVLADTVKLLLVLVGSVCVLHPNKSLILE